MAKGFRIVEGEVSGSLMERGAAGTLKGIKGKLAGG